MINRIFIHIVLFFTISGYLYSQNVSFRAEGPGVVEIGEQFEIMFTITEKPQNFTAPEFKGLSYLGGPSTSSSTSVSIVNGQMTQQTTISYSYYFVANTPGKFQIEPAKAVINGKEFSSNSLMLEVVGGSNQTQQPTQQNSAGKTNQSNVDTDQSELFIRILIDRNTLYQGEHIIATVKIYTKLNISSLSDIKWPSFAGFFRQDIETPPLRSLEKENVNGQIYSTGVLQRILLSPQKSGTLTIDPMQLTCVVQQVVRNNRRPRSVFDDFWGPQVQEIPRDLKSNPLKITVLPLPSNKPSNFTGAVGTFAFKATLDKNNVQTNDAITLKINISGKGNLKIIEPFKISFPADFETYDPKVSVNVQNTTAGSSGSKSFEYLVIPRHSGEFTIPAIEFSYFDPTSKEYKTLSSGDFNISVSKGSDEPSTVIASSIDKTEIKVLGKDIQYIKTHSGKLQQIDTFYFGTLSFWLVYIISSALFTLIVVLRRKQIRDNANIALMRKRKANKVARQRLKESAKYIKENNPEKFYDNLLKALWGYLSDKFNISLSNLSREVIKETLESKSTDPQFYTRFIDLADICELSRYSPNNSAAQLDEVYNKAVQLISEFEQKIK